MIINNSEESGGEITTTSAPLMVAPAATLSDGDNFAATDGDLTTPTTLPLNMSPAATTQQDVAQNNGSASAATSESSSSVISPSAMADDTLHVEISDALSEKDKVKFTVHTRTTLPGFSKSDNNVVRQHEEFVWLHDRFEENEEYAGYIVSLRIIVIYEG